MNSKTLLSTELQRESTLDGSAAWAGNSCFQPYRRLPASFAIMVSDYSHAFLQRQQESSSPASYPQRESLVEPLLL
ncbi:MAG: hypothetical protein E6Q24_15015 [Chitinophagaceae bacterium]|nr:MAG: hypothetical protein E6Q24_15015 [Chitinophagaceae bacterium]